MLKERAVPGNERRRLQPTYSHWNYETIIGKLSLVKDTVVSVCNVDAMPAS